MSRKKTQSLETKPSPQAEVFVLRTCNNNEENGMEQVGCTFRYRDSNCLALAVTSECPALAIGCFGCVSTRDNGRLIPVQGGTEVERDAFRRRLAEVADS
jgi:hypothetical protein